MNTKTISSLGKLTCPQAHNLIPRPRLFQRLDHAITGKLLWMTAPAGMGKTSLLSSWINTRNCEHLWYQIDRDDNDLAAFIYYLGLAAQRLVAIKTPLPKLTPDFLPSLETFLRQFFRELFAALQEQSVLVFDNYQETTLDATLHRALDIALNELPPNLCIIVLSREQPPSILMPRLAYCDTSTLTKTELLLTEAESQALTAAWGINADQTAELFDKSRGWAGIQVLLMRSLESGQAIQSQGLKDESIASFLGDKLYKSLTPMQQTLLPKLALLPVVTAEQAEALTNQAEIGKTLEELAQGHFFIERRETPKIETISYQFHPLVHEYLLERLESDNLPEELSRLKCHAAELLIAEANVEAAYELFKSARAWTELEQFLQRFIPEFLDQGRWQSVLAWLDELPLEMIQNAWLLYWRGVATLAVDPSKAQKYLTQALACFTKDTNGLGQALVASAITDAIFFEYRDFHPLDSLIPIMEQALSLEQLPPPIEARLIASLIVALMHRQPSHPQLSGYVDRAFAGLEQETQPNQRLLTASLLIVWCGWNNDIKQAIRVLTVANQALIEVSRISPMCRTLWWVSRGFFAFFEKDAEVLTSMAENIETEITEHGLYTHANIASLYYALAKLIQGNTVQASELLRQLRDSTQPFRKIELNLLLMYSAWCALTENDYEEAIRLSTAAIDLSDQSGGIYIQLNSRLTLIHALTLSEHPDQTTQLLSEIEELMADWSDSISVFSSWLATAHTYLKKQDSTMCNHYLNKAFQLARQNGFQYPYLDLPQVLAECCAVALQHDIESTYVHQLIRKRQLSPPTLMLNHWPYPICIYTLGRTEILLDGIPLQFSGKAQKKPLELLYCLLALGGRSVSIDKLTDFLWVDEEADHARHNLEVNLSRLRKLLNRNDALLLREGELSLNERCCWVDVWALQHLLDQTEQPAVKQDPYSHCKKVLALYRGPFMEGKEIHHLFAHGNKLAVKFHRYALAIGEQLEIVKDWQSACELYESILERLPQTDSAYHRLIHIHMKLGNRLEVMSIFTRYSAMLKEAFGKEPEPALYKLFEGPF